MTEPDQDIWSQWLLHRRSGGDAEAEDAALTYLHQVRDWLVSASRLGENEVLLDVGCGDGLVAFGALEQTTATQVIFSDISQDLLDRAQSIADEKGVTDRCRFLNASADDLSAVPDASVDAVTTRSVLIYVAAKAKALREFHRVLKAGGRLSIFEPINRFAYLEPSHLFRGWDVGPVMALAQKVREVYRFRQPADTDPMLDFDERDLVRLAEEAGFREIRLDLQVMVGIAPGPDAYRWDAYWRSSPNPKAPTLEEAVGKALTPDEAERFVAHLRPLVERGEGASRGALAYLWALKDGAA